MTKDDDILFNFKSCYTGLLINAESDFKTGRESNLLRNLEFFAQKNIDENLSNRTLQILQSEHRKDNKHFLRTFREELEVIQERIERVEKDNKGNFLLNQLSISLDGFTAVWTLLIEAYTIYLVEEKQQQFEKQKNSKGISKVKKIKSWCSEYELRGFIDMALRWGIDGVYESRTENNPYSVFDHYVKNARTNFDLFADQLNTKLTKNENWKAIEIDLNSRFLKGLNQYIDWYEENRNELKKFQPYCPYTLMLNVIESTKAEILKYFTEFANETSRPQQSEKPKPEQEETERSKRTEKLESIWLSEPKLTIKDFILKGNDKRFWNDNLELNLQRKNSTYGTGKTFLGNVFIAFKGWAIPNHTDYKVAGKIFCEAFNIDIKESTKEPYKAFSSGNEKQIREIKRIFGVVK